MMDLFQIRPQLSPRLAWMKNHNVRLHEFTSDPDDVSTFNHCGFGRWLAFVGKMPRSENDGTWACADTEDAALVGIAKLNGWLLWNEEAATAKPLNRKHP